jgi:hypothetical protein
MTEINTAQPDMAAAMAEYAKFAAPGAHHERFGKLAGQWSVKMKHWMSADAPPAETEGTADLKPIFGNRYLVQTYKGDFMGHPFEGMGVTGYNNYRQEYNHLWMDSMGTAMMFSTGKSDDGGKTIEYTATMDDPGQNRKNVPFRMIEQRPDDNTIRIEMFCADASGTEFKNMEIHYKRQS